MKEEKLICEIDKIKDLIKGLTWSDLRSDDLVFSITKLKILLDDMFGIMKVRKKVNLPYILPEK